MSKFFTEGETKIRPGVYKRYSNASANENMSGAMNGVVAVVLQAPFGPVGTVTVHTKESTIRETYGDCAGVNAAIKALEGVNAVGTTPKIYIVRLKGNGGTNASVTLDSAVTVTAKYPGNFPITVKVQVNALDENVKEILVLSGTSLKEKFEYAANSSDESAAFVSTVAGSKYITASASGSGVVSAQEKELTGGANPTVSNEDYLEGCEALDQYNYNVIITDSVSADVASILKNYADSAYADGKNIMVVTGSADSVDFATRKSAAAAKNDEKVIYFGSGYVKDDGTVVNGSESVAMVAGIIAGTPSNRSIVHTQIPGAVDVNERLTNSQYEEAIQNGLLLLSVGPDGQVWIDSGINTLVTPNANQDNGWKKIKRVKVRFELFDRLDKILEPKVGKVNTDADGIAYIIQCGNEVIQQMLAEGGKLSSARFVLDTNGYEADSAWFVIEAVDVDSLEKIYLHYRFKYAQD